MEELFNKYHDASEQFMLSIASENDILAKLKQ